MNFRGIKRISSIRMLCSYIGVCLILMLLVGIRWNHHLLNKQENTQDWKFAKFKLEEWEKDKLVMPWLSMDGNFNEIQPGMFCFINGTNMKISMKNKECVCRFDYFGSDCGIPDSVWFGHFKQFETNMISSGLVKRETPRRVIQTMVVNHEFELFEARVRHYGDTVDAYIILESNYSEHGDKKNLDFFYKLSIGWLSEYQDKFLYIFLSFFHPDAVKDGWFAVSYPRTFMGKHGLPRLLNLKEDDLVIYNDADEIPDRNVLTFLKLYDGYTEPIKLSYRWTIFGYYWLSVEGDKEQLHSVPAVCTVGMMNHVFHNDSYALRSSAHTKPEFQERIASYEREVKEWNVGVVGHYADRLLLDIIVHGAFHQRESKENLCLLKPKINLDGATLKTDWIWITSAD